MKTAWNVRAGASEFPHANPALDWGGAWLGSALCELPRDITIESTAEPSATTEPLSAATEMPLKIITEHTTEVGPDTTGESEPLADPLPEPANDMQHLQSSTSESVPEIVAPPIEEVIAMEPIAVAADAVEPVAVTAVPPDAADNWSLFVEAVETVLEQLGGLEVATRARNLLNGNEDRATVSNGIATLLTTAAAWRSVLIGERQDLDGCGDTTLDEWAARLVAELAPTGTATTNVRRELRRHGVAAFGMVPTAKAHTRSEPMRAKESEPAASTPPGQTTSAVA